MITRWIVNEPEGRRKGCVIGLPGRGVPAEMMEKICTHAGLLQSVRICLEPELYRWYPAPNGAEDQDDAIEGLEAARLELEKVIRRIQSMWRLRREQIALVGYSAGSVMALQVMAEADTPFAGVVSIAGAILEPDKMPPAKNQTPILLRHNRDDDCFEWEERYLPMKNALVDGKYNVHFSERNWGGHGVNRRDAHDTGNFLAEHLGYDPEDVIANQD